MVAPMLDVRTASAAAGLLALALWPLVAGSFGVDLVTKTMVYAIVALSLELLVGRTGLVCFGQAAFFGLAGYAAVMLSPQSDAASLLWLLPVSVAVAAAYALFMGALSLRTRGVYFIMVTLAFAQMAYYVIHDTPLGGGTDGIYLYVKPVVEIGGTLLLDLDQPLSMYYFVLACLAAVFVFLALLMRSRFGRALSGIKINEQRMRATGFSTYPYKLAAFVIAGATAGLAGALLANQARFVSPTLLSWQLSGMLIVMVILGGVGTVAGPSVGAAVVLGLEEVLTASTQHWQLGLGLVLLLVVLRAPGGITGLVAAGRRALYSRGWLKRERLPVPVIGRIEKDAYCLDLRGLEEPEAFLAQLPRLALR